MGVSKDATQEQIKKAYRQKSKQYHPDINPDGADKFKEISEAYEVIGNVEKRKNYDNPQRQNPFGDFNDPFASFFDRFRNNFNGPQKIITVNLTPEEVFKGVKKEIVFQKNEKCDSCGGVGGQKVICKSCNGHGIINDNSNGIFSMGRMCNDCQGSGYQIENKCFKCNGKGLNGKFEKLMINIPANVNHNDTLQVRGKGDFIMGKGYGNLLLKINIKKENGFEKIGNDLLLNFNIDIKDFISKKSIEVSHPDGRLNIPLPDEISTERPLRIKNKGYGNNGNFLIRLIVSRTKVDTDYQNNN